MKLKLTGTKIDRGICISLKRRKQSEKEFKRILPDFFEIELDTKDFVARENNHTKKKLQ